MLDNEVYALQGSLKQHDENKDLIKYTLFPFIFRSVEIRER